MNNKDDFQLLWHYTVQYIYKQNPERNEKDRQIYYMVMAEDVFQATAILEADLAKRRIEKQGVSAIRIEFATRKQVEEWDKHETEQIDKHKPT